MSIPENKVQRAGKRYSYPRAAQCEIGSEVYEIQIQNISASGLQFSIRVQIEAKEPIRVQWRDSQYGNFNINLIVAREVHKPEQRDFQYFYGSQYYNLSTDAKERLVKLLKNFKSEEEKVNQLQVEKSTPEHIMEVLEQGATYLRRAFNDMDGDPDPYFENILKQIADYEKTAFLMEDPVSLILQKVVTYNFHCNLLGILAAQIAETGSLMKAKYFEAIKTELSIIIQVENEVDEIVKNIPIGSSNEEKMNIQRRLNESSNRLFYTKQNLLQSVVETFSTDGDHPNHRDAYNKIKDEYEKILDFTSSGAPVESLTYKRRTKDPHHSQDIKEVIEVPVMSQEKPSTTLWLGGIFLFIFGMGFLVFKGMQMKDKHSFEDKISIGIEVLAFNKFDTQVEIRVDTAQWTAMPIPKKEEAFKKIVKFLLDDKGAKSCIIFDSNSNIIRTLYEEALPGNLKVDPVHSVASQQPANGVTATPATSGTTSAPVETKSTPPAAK